MYRTNLDVYVTRVNAYGGGSSRKHRPRVHAICRPEIDNPSFPYLRLLFITTQQKDLIQSCARGGEEDSGGHVLQDTTSLGL
jgi:hypothetical protein